MGWELEDVLATAQIPDQSDAVQIASAKEGAIALEAHCVYGARVTLLNKEFFLLFHVVQTPSLVMGSACQVNSHRMELNSVHDVIMFANID